MNRREVVAGVGALAVLAAASIPVGAAESDVVQSFLDAKKATADRVYAQEIFAVSGHMLRFVANLGGPMPEQAVQVYTQLLLQKDVFKKREGSGDMWDVSAMYSRDRLTIAVYLREKGSPNWRIFSSELTCNVGAALEPATLFEVEGKQYCISERVFESVGPARWVNGDLEAESFVEKKYEQA